MRIRVLPSDVQARTFELLGAEPYKCDLTEALAAIKAGTVDAQENPLANTVTYGAHKFHPFITLTSHFYVSRPIFVYRTAFDAWPKALQQAMRKAVQEAVAIQRNDTVEEERAARKAIEEAGGKITELTLGEQAAFAAAVMPQLDDAESVYGKEMMRLAAGR